jgi:hypothetical protein
MKHRAFFVSIALLAAGCVSSTSTNGQNTTALTQPKAGSIFVYHHTVWDTLSRVVEDYYDTDVVVQSGISFAGKNNVNALRLNSDTALAHQFYRSYEPNNDLAYYIDIPNTRAGWPTWPIASKQPYQYLQIDTTYIDSRTGQSIHSIRRFDFSYVKDTSIVMLGKTFDAPQILFKAGNQFGYQNFTEYFWIAPSLGMEVRILQSIGPPYAQNISGWQTDLVSYVLK